MGGSSICFMKEHEYSLTYFVVSNGQFLIFFTFTYSGSPLLFFQCCAEEQGECYAALWRLSFQLGGHPFLSCSLSLQTPGEKLSAVLFVLFEVTECISVPGVCYHMRPGHGTGTSVFSLSPSRCSLAPLTFLSSPLAFRLTVWST